MKGSKGGGWEDPKITVLCYYLSFVPLFTNVEANICLLDQGIHVEGFEKEGDPFFPRKLKFYVRLSCEGALVAAGETFSIFVL